MTTTNLIFENRQNDYLVSIREAMTFQGYPLNPLVFFAELDNVGDENEWGQIRFYKSGVNEDPVFIFQLRAKNALTEDSKKRNLTATTRLTLSEMQQIVSKMEEMSGQTVPDESSLHDRIRELENQVLSLTLLLKEKQDAIQLAMEG